MPGLPKNGADDIPFFRMPSGLSAMAGAAWGSTADMVKSVEELLNPSRRNVNLRS